MYIDMCIGVCVGAAHCDILKYNKAVILHQYDNTYKFNKLSLLGNYKG